MQYLLLFPLFFLVGLLIYVLTDPIPHTRRMIEKEMGELDIEDCDNLEEYMESEYGDENLSHIEIGSERARSRLQSNDEDNARFEMNLHDIITL